MTQGLRTRLAPWAKTTLLRCGGYSALRQLRPSRSVAILRYHAICGPEGHGYADPAICITPQAFERHVAYLTKHYAVMPLVEAVDRLRADRPLPNNAVAITFDDGYADNLPAARVLARHGATATFYITAGCMAGGLPFWPAEIRTLVANLREPAVTLAAGPVNVTIPVGSATEKRAAVLRITKLFKSQRIPVREQLREQLRQAAGSPPLPDVMLTWDEVREMRHLGMTIGAHTITHPNLPSAGLQAATAEIRGSKARLEDETAAPVTMFSYPNGGAERYYTPELQAAVSAAGFEAAASSWNGFAGAHSDIYALERIEVQERLEDFIFALEVERFAFRPNAGRAPARASNGEQDAVVHRS